MEAEERALLLGIKFELDSFTAGTSELAAHRQGARVENNQVSGLGLNSQMGKDEWQWSRV